MNEGLILRWNQVVSVDDTVIVVGDFCFGNSSKRTEILNRLNGTKILVQGNHDKGNITPKGFDLMVREMSMTIAGHKVSIKHYPLKYKLVKGLWAKYVQRRRPKHLDRMDVDRGQYHIHGHTHSTVRFNENQIHVGCDAWDCTPIPIKTIEKYIAIREIKHNLKGG